MPLNRWFNTFIILMFLALLGFLTYNAWFQSYHFDVYPIDGGFQLYNPLRRIAAGQIPGVNDFQYFHGFGLILAHYPIYALLGHTLFASEFSRWELTMLLFSIGNYALFRAFGLSQTLSCLFCTGLIFLGVSGYLESLLYPGNSIRGVRSFLPLLSIAFFTVLMSRRESWFLAQFRLEAFGAVTAALALWFGVDQGINYLATFSILYWVLQATRHRMKASLLPFLGFLGLYGLLVMVFSFVITLGNLPAALGMLKYNLLMVPQDQIWYFGVPPNDFIADFADFFRGNHREFLISLLVDGFLILWVGTLIATKRFAAISKAQALGILFLLIYGVFSTSVNLSYYGTVNLQILRRCDVIVMAILAVHALPILKSRISVRFKLPGPLPEIFKGLAMSILALGLVFATYVDVSAFHNFLLAEFSQTRTLYSGVLLSDAWEKNEKLYSKLFPPGKSVAQGQLWSTYAGFLEDKLGIFHPYRDYIIHALGVEDRKAYLNRFVQAKPQLVTTVLSNFSTYERWLQETTWDFYETLLMNYDCLDKSFHSVLWQRKPDSLWRTRTPPDLNLPFSVKDGHLQLDFPRQLKAFPPDSILVLTLQYEIENPWEKIPLLGKLPRYLINLKSQYGFSTVSLPPKPYEGRLRFPLFVKNASVPDLEIRVAPQLPGVRLEIRRVGCHLLQLTPTQHQALYP